MADSDVPAAGHVLRLSVSVRSRANRVVRQLQCSDCDLRVTFTIVPIEQGENFVHVLQAAHIRQIEEANRG